MDYEGVKTRVRDNAAGVYVFAQRQADRVVSPDQRQRAYNATYEFATAKPFLFAFLVSQLAFSFIPVLIFVAFVASVTVFALGAAVIFTAFWFGVALVILVPTLFLTVGIGFLVWAWAVGSFIIGRWIYNLLPASVRAKVENEAPSTNGTTVLVNKDADTADGHENN